VPRLAAAVVSLFLAGTAGADSGTAPLTGARVSQACRITGIPYPQEALAAGAGSLWLACRDGASIERRTPAGNLVARIPVPPGFRPWAIAAAGGSVFVADRDQSLLLRLATRTNRIAGRTRLPEPAISVWTGAGSAWVAFDGSGAVARIDQHTGRVGPNIDVGDGPAGFASRAGRVWGVAHRDGSLVRIEGRSVRQLHRLPADDRTTPERLAYSGDSLWVTGRGLDLVRVDPDSGEVRGSTEIGPAGIDVIALGKRVAVVAATPKGARRGDPLIASVSLVDPATGEVKRTVPASSLSLTGLTVLAGRLVIFDGLHGRLLSLAP
jgi:hypothetical protein